MSDTMQQTDDAKGKAEKSSRFAPEIGPIQQTLFIPLYGRAKETEKSSGLLKDAKAVEIVNAIDYDFSKWDSAKTLVSASFRTLMYDDFVRRFLDQHPAGTVVEIGCGLNTRFERLDNGQASWFDLDLPDVIDLRKQFFSDQPRRKMLAASVLQQFWLTQVQATGGPWMFISEAALIYLKAEDVKQAVLQIAAAFPGAYLLFDTTAREMVKGQYQHDAMKHMPEQSWFKWACDDPKEVAQWHPSIALLESNTFVDADKALIAKMPLGIRLGCALAPWLMRWMTRQYRINLCKL